jgi:type II secretory pathway component GspD/PulD (secretin)
VTRTELLVLITPSVVENPARARAVTDELRRRLRSLEQLESRVR